MCYRNGRGVWKRWKPRSSRERESPVVESRGVGSDTEELAPVASRASTVFEEFARIRNDIANLNQVVATFATSVSTLQNALSGIELRLTTAMSEQAETAASALATGLSNVESNLTTAMNTQADAPSLADIESTVSAALDDKIGTPEHLDEQTQNLVPATGLYALTNGAQGGTDILSNPWLALAIANYLTPHIMETLLGNINLPVEWLDAARHITYKSILAHWPQYSPEQIQGLWTRRGPSALPYTEEDQLALVRGTTDHETPFVIAVRVWTSNHYEVWRAQMNDTDPRGGFVDSDLNNPSIVDEASTWITHAVATANRVDEMVMMTRWTMGSNEDRSEHPTDLEMPNPFEDGNHDTYEDARERTSKIIYLMQDIINNPIWCEYKFLQYLDPSVTEPWITPPTQ
ncbi:MAG: hypothetical protein LBJ69_03275 [Holosporales bacterium]|jgi:hypothetical protein|nr:hypothetical protein [Holosporales bacterium]